MANYGTFIQESYAPDQTWLRGNHAVIEVMPCTIKVDDFGDYKQVRGNLTYIVAGTPVAYDGTKKTFVPFQNGTTGALEGFLSDDLCLELRNPPVADALMSMVTHCTIRKSCLPEAAKAQITYETLAAAHGTFRLEVEA